MDLFAVANLALFFPNKWMWDVSFQKYAPKCVLCLWFLSVFVHFCVFWSLLSSFIPLSITSFVQSAPARVVLVSCSCRARVVLVSYSCPARVLLVSCSCPARVLLVFCSCLARVLLVSCSCPARVVLVSCSCRARVLLVSCWCPARVLLVSCSCPARILLASCSCSARVLLVSCSCPARVLLVFCLCPARVLLVFCLCPSRVLLRSCSSDRVKSFSFFVSVKVFCQFGISFVRSCPALFQVLSKRPGEQRNQPVFVFLWGGFSLVRKRVLYHVSPLVVSHLAPGSSL